MVFIVGAGPGDPDLLTLKALRLLQEADVIVHDRLVGAGILDHARRDARRLDVGKRAGDHPVSQGRINGILIDEARAGHRVVRLKGGDPFVFGRGGEERDALIAAGVRVEVVPGITAATGCAAAAGIPLTHRDDAHAVTFITGHRREGLADTDSGVGWRALAGPGRTLAVYMGATTATATTAGLIADGLDPATPVAVIENGTLPGQSVRLGVLAGLGELVAGSGDGPVLILIGDSVRRADAWPAGAPGVDRVDEPARRRVAAV